MFYTALFFQRQVKILSKQLDVCFTCLRIDVLCREAQQPKVFLSSWNDSTTFMQTANSYSSGFYSHKAGVLSFMVNVYFLQFSMWLGYLIVFICRAFLINLPLLIIITAISNVVGFVIYSYYKNCDPLTSGAITAIDQVN